MADQKITDLTALTALAAGDLVEVVDVSDTSMAATGTNKKVAISNFSFGPVRVADGRLTTESGVPISTSDRASQSTLYYTPYIGNQIALYDGASWKLHTFTERSLALSGLTSGKNYDVFLYDNAGTLTLELSAAWTDDTTRADALTTQDGVYVKSGATTRRYLGTIRTTGATTTEDSLTKRYVWNSQNRTHRRLVKEDSGSHTINNTAAREWGGGTAVRAEFVIGLAGDLAVNVFSCRITSSFGNVFFYPALDTSGAPFGSHYNGGNFQHRPNVTGGFYPGIGYHYFTGREAEFASSNATMDYGRVEGWVLG